MGNKHIKQCRILNKYISNTIFFFFYVVEIFIGTPRPLSLGRGRERGGSAGFYRPKPSWWPSLTPKEPPWNRESMHLRPPGAISVRK